MELEEIRRYLDNHPDGFLTVEARDLPDIDDGILLSISGRMECSSEYLVRTFYSIVSYGVRYVVADFRQALVSCKEPWGLGSVEGLLGVRNGYMVICVPQGKGLGTLTPVGQRSTLIEEDLERAIEKMRGIAVDESVADYVDQVAARLPAIPGVEMSLSRTQDRPWTAILNLAGTISELRQVLAIGEAARYLVDNGFRYVLLDLKEVIDSTEPDAVDRLNKRKPGYPDSLILSEYANCESLCIHLLSPTVFSPKYLASARQFHFRFIDEFTSINTVSPNLSGLRRSSNRLLLEDQESHRFRMGHNERPSLGVRWSTERGRYVLTQIEDQFCCRCGRRLRGFLPGCYRCPECHSPIIAGFGGNVARFASHTPSWPSEVVAERLPVWSDTVS
jgi:hypothetical protein